MTTNSLINYKSTKVIDKYKCTTVELSIDFSLNSLLRSGINSKLLIEKVNCPLIDELTRILTELKLSSYNFELETAICVDLNKILQNTHP